MKWQSAYTVIVWIHSDWSLSTNSLGVAWKWKGILQLSQNKKEKENKKGEGLTKKPVDIFLKLILFPFASNVEVLQTESNMLISLWFKLHYSP